MLELFSKVFADPVYQWVIVIGLPYLFQVLHAKGKRLPLLEGLVNILGGAARADVPPALASPSGSPVKVPTLQEIWGEVEKLRSRFEEKK